MNPFKFGPDTHSSLAVGCYAGSEVPGRAVSRAMGLVEHSVIFWTSDVALAPEQALKGLSLAAKKHGANAVINVRMTQTSGISRGLGPKACIVAYGDAVILS